MLIVLPLLLIAFLLSGCVAFIALGNAISMDRAAAIESFVWGYFRIIVALALFGGAVFAAGVMR